VLVALDAIIHTTERSLSAAEFTSGLKVEETLRPGELVVEVEITIPQGAITHYDKFRLRESVDWAIVALASIFAIENSKITGARLVLGGVAPVPLRLNEVEGYLFGKELNEDTIAQAGELAVKEVFPLWNNLYKVQEVKAYVDKALRRLI
jgi:CO/xanthine dehydrogenase FAD-binding subunit